VTLYFRIFLQPEWVTVVLTKSSCPMIDEDIFYSRIGRGFKVCSNWRNAVLTQLERIKPDVVIIGSTATANFTETQWTEGSSRIFQRLSTAAKLVIVIPGTPSLGYDGPGCLARHSSEKNNAMNTYENCKANNRFKAIDSVKSYLSRAAGRFPNVHILDLNELVCPNGTCRAITQEGIVVFRDSQHLTVHSYNR